MIFKDSCFSCIDFFWSFVPEQRQKLLEIVTKEGLSPYLFHAENQNDYETKFFHDTQDDLSKMIDYFTIFNFDEREKLFKKEETNSIINQILSQSGHVEILL